MNDSLVSVVVPTCRRPAEVVRAVESVLGQTYPWLELLVIIDGPDPETRSALMRLQDLRVNVIELTENVGAAQARNRGVASARGKWIAFLDDDDEWLPEKLAEQVKVATSLGGDRVLLASRYIDRGSNFERILPHRSPRPGESLSELLFCKKGLSCRSGMLQTSTFFVSRQLARAVPFRPEIRPQEDLDWIMRAGCCVDRPFHLLHQPLSIYHNEKTTGREGALGAFDFFWSYAHQNRNLFTPRSFSSYVATFCAPEVKFAARPLDRWRQVYRGMKSGKMTLRTLAFALIFALFPFETRRRIRLALGSLLGFRRALTIQANS